MALGNNDGRRERVFPAVYARAQRKRAGKGGRTRRYAVGACAAWLRPPDGTLSPDPKTVPIVQRAFQMRADGAPITQIRAMLKSHGVERSPRGVQVMLASRVYLGEVHFGDLSNLHAHEPIIDRELWERVQRRKIPRGRKTPSNFLLARLGVLRLWFVRRPVERYENA